MLQSRLRVRSYPLSDREAALTDAGPACGVQVRRKSSSSTSEIWVSDAELQAFLADLWVSRQTDDHRLLPHLRRCAPRRGLPISLDELLNLR